MHHSLLVGAVVAVLGAIVGWRFIGAGGPAADAAAVEAGDEAAEPVPVA